MLTVQSPLGADLEALIHEIIGCSIRVHRELGPGLLEKIYVRALQIELDASGLGFDTERMVSVTYRGQLLCRQRLDLVVAERVLLEIKAVDRLAPVHMAQTMSYLRLSELRVALLMNFNVAVLPDGL
jgi:GxxExxY protein